MATLSDTEYTRLYKIRQQASTMWTVQDETLCPAEAKSLCDAFLAKGSTTRAMRVLSVGAGDGKNDRSFYNCIRNFLGESGATVEYVCIEPGAAHFEELLELPEFAPLAKKQNFRECFASRIQSDLMFDVVMFMHTIHLCQEPIQRIVADALTIGHEVLLIQQTSTGAPQILRVAVQNEILDAFPKCIVPAETILEYLATATEVESFMQRYEAQIDVHDLVNLKEGGIDLLSFMAFQSLDQNFLQNPAKFKSFAADAEKLCTESKDGQLFVREDVAAIRCRKAVSSVVTSAA